MWVFFSLCFSIFSNVFIEPAKKELLVVNLQLFLFIYYFYFILFIIIIVYIHYFHLHLQLCKYFYTIASRIIIAKRPKNLGSSSFQTRICQVPKFSYFLIQFYYYFFIKIINCPSWWIQGFLEFSVTALWHISPTAFSSVLFPSTNIRAFLLALRPVNSSNRETPRSIVLSTCY